MPSAISKLDIFAYRHLIFAEILKQARHVYINRFFTKRSAYTVFAVVTGQKSHNNACKRCFAASVFADDAYFLPFVDIQWQIFKRKIIWLWVFIIDILER